MTGRNSLFTQLVSVTALAVGATIVWLAVIGWGSTLLKTLFGGQERIYEGIVMKLDGEALIVTTVYSGSNNNSYRRLDGTRVNFEENNNTLYPVGMELQPGPPGLLENPLRWRNRMANTSDLANPATYWHLVRDDKMPGRAYFVGYDSVTKRLAGYLGHQGFRESLPPAEEWFDVGRFLVTSWPQYYAGGNSLNRVDSYNSWRYRSASNQTSPPDWVGFLIDGGQVLKIDFRQREVSMFDKSQGATSVGFALQPRAVEEQAIDDNGDELERPKTVRRFLVRYPERIVIWDLKKQTNETFSLPESLHNGSIDVYTLGNGKIVVQSGEGYWERGPRYRLIWLDKEGNELRNELVKFIGHRPRTEEELAWDDAWAVPLPGYWLYRMLARRPFELRQYHGSPSYTAAMQQTWQAGWLLFVILLALSAVATAIVWRWHRNYLRPHRYWWSLFTFLFSVPGLFAYRFFFGKAVLEKCPQCGQEVPRDQDACAGCEQPFAEPGLLGTEVFA